MTTSRHAECIDTHYADSWGERSDVCDLRKGPRHELPAEFRVLVFERTPPTSAYATRCMSTAEDDEGLELHMFARGLHEELVELLTVVAHYHRTGARLGLGHTVNFGRPWLPGSRCTFGLISLPYLDGPALEWLVAPRIRFLWLLPITAQEREFKKRHGVDALESLFEEAAFDYLDPLRASVV